MTIFFVPILHGKAFQKPWNSGKKWAQHWCFNHIQEEHLVARKHIRESLAICFSLRTPLLLSGLPLVTIVSSKAKIQEGGNLTFTCQVTGSPTPSVRWQTEELHSNAFTQVRLRIIFGSLFVYIFMHYLFFSAAYILFLPFFELVG